MKKILTVSLGALLIATAANADIASVDYVTDVANSKQDASTIGTVTAGNMGTTASTVVGAISEVAGEAAAAQSTANAAQTTANSALTKANAAVVANNAIQAGAGTKITYDSKGLVTGSSSLTASDIPTLSISKVDGLQTALNSKQDKLTIDSELSKTSTNPVQNKVVAEELAGKQNASTAVEVTTAGTAVGSAMVPVYVNASGVVAPITSYAGNAATATKATEDASGNVITTTYATKTELAGKQDKLTIDSALNTGSTNPVQNMVVAKALNEKQAVLGYTPENSANKVTTATGLTASSTDTQYPSAKLVYTAVNGKQDKLTTSNIKGSNGVSVGISNGVITVTGTTYSTGTDTESGLTKLYPEIGSNTDGTMTQSAIKAALGTKQDTIDDLGTIRSGATLGASAVQPATLGNYATKTALTTGLNGKQDLVANGTDGNFYVADYKSAWGDMFTLMPKDKKCNDADVKCALTHKNGKYGWEIVRE